MSISQGDLVRDENYTGLNEDDGEFEQIGYLGSGFFLSESRGIFKADPNGFITLAPDFLNLSEAKKAIALEVGKKVTDKISDEIADKIAEKIIERLSGAGENAYNSIEPLIQEAAEDAAEVLSSTDIHQIIQIVIDILQTAPLP